MPVGVLETKTKIEKTTLVFDTWAPVEDSELLLTSRTVSLEAAELTMLNLLVGRLNCLGRSESWVEGRVVGDGEQTPEINCFPEEAGETPGRGWEQVSLLAPYDASEFRAWRTERLEETLAELPLPQGRKPGRTLLAKRGKTAAPYPADLLDCLQKDTTWLRFHGWNRPPGSRRVFYWRPTDAISIGVPKRRAAALSDKRVEAMLLSLTNASHNDHALPPVTRALPQAELLHRTLAGLAVRRGTPPPSSPGATTTAGHSVDRTNMRTSIPSISTATDTWTTSLSGHRAGSVPRPRTPSVPCGRRSPRAVSSRCAWLWRRRAKSEN